jgi:hypothetical protein
MPVAPFEYALHWLNWSSCSEKQAKKNWYLELISNVRRAQSAKRSLQQYVTWLNACDVSSETFFQAILGRIIAGFGYYSLNVCDG